jgi:hypothetical protein
MPVVLLISQKDYELGMIEQVDIKDYFLMRMGILVADSLLLEN